MSHCEPRQNEHEELTTKNQRDDKREDNERETADAKQLTRNNEREANANNRRACHARTSARTSRTSRRKDHGRTEEEDVAIEDPSPQGGLEGLSSDRDDMHQLR